MISKSQVLFLGLFLLCGLAFGEGVGTVEQDLGASKEASRTDDEVVQREGEAIKLDGLNPEQIKQLREKQENHTFQAEVSRMMKLIINSLYRNKEVFCRELISNASDALDKIRLISLTDSSALDSNNDLHIKVKADKDNNILHITDTGVGMTKDELIKNLGMIAKSGTADFFAKLQEDDQSGDKTSDLIGQFGVGFYSAFLVADRVVVTSKHNDDDQHIWESDSGSFSVVKDPRGNTLGRGTTISLYLKEEAHDFLEVDTLKNLIKKYSQFINFNIYLWDSRTEEVEEPIEDEEEAVKDEADNVEDEEGTVEEEKEDKPKTKKVTKTVWDYVLINESKPIWTRKATEITDEEYNNFYKTLSKDSTDPLCRTHFSAEGEVSFKSLIYVPKAQPTENLHRYGTKTENIKLYVRRVFITDDFQDMLPNYLAFLRGLVDSDDLPLNVSRENLQQHKLLKVIKKKLVRKAIDMLSKLDKETFDVFWKEYSTNIKLGIIEDTANRNRLAKLLRFPSSSQESTSLIEYIERMKEKQQQIFYMAGASLKEVESSPFVERLLKKGYEVLYLVEAVDEYAINAIPEFEGKKFQNVAKEGFEIDDGAAFREMKKQLEEKYEPLTKWLAETALKESIAKAEVSHRLTESPCALISSRFGWTANMERIIKSQTHSKSKDSQREHQMNQKKTLEINPRHPLVKELLKRVDSDPDDESAKDIATMMYKTAILRSGYTLDETVEFAKTVEEMMRKTLGVPLDEPIEEEPELPEDEPEEEPVEETAEEDEEADEVKDEL